MKSGSLLAIDVIGALVVAACLGVGVWYGSLNTESASGRLRELSTQVEELDRHLAQTQSALDIEQDAHRRLQAESGDGDLLPEGAPVERDLKAVTDLTRRNRLELIQFTPAGSQRYPGVLELRYRLSAKGAFKDYMRFLRDFEASSSWADITYLKLDSPNTRTEGGKPGELTVSLYSAIRDQVPETATP